MIRPLCFVLMPFGSKPDPAGVLIDFDAVYRDLFAPASEGAGLQPIRADEELTAELSTNQCSSDSCSATMPWRT